MNAGPKVIAIPFTKTALLARLLHETIGRRDALLSVLLSVSVALVVSGAVRALLQGVGWFAGLIIRATAIGEAVARGWISEDVAMRALQ